MREHSPTRPGCHLRVLVSGFGPCPWLTAGAHSQTIALLQVLAGHTVF
uniref:Uncharacterized protein n=1 Tax=Anguilla anguilla TaxID=7936 RepID=A0A0E9UVR0_ANGAN